MPIAAQSFIHQIRNEIFTTHFSELCLLFSKKNCLLKNSALNVYYYVC